MSYTQWQLVAAVGFGLVTLSACTAEYPRGAIVCTSDPSDCPEGMSCRLVGDSGEGRCFPDIAAGSLDSGSAEPAPEKVDATTGSAELIDASQDASQRVDAEAAPGGSGGAGGRAESGGSGGGAGGAGGRAAPAPAAGSGGGGTGGRPVPAAGSGGGGMGGRATPAAGSGGTSEPEPKPCDDPARQCDPTDVDSEEGDCGACNTGSHTHSRKCDAATCTWQAWSAWSTCAPDMTKCTPGSTETRSANCPHCGTKKQTRTCSTTTCTFGAWTDASKCSWCDECAHVEWCETPDDVVKNRGTWCWPENGCNNDQAWGRCQEILKELSCTVHQPVYTGH